MQRPNILSCDAYVQQDILYLPNKEELLLSVRQTYRTQKMLSTEELKVLIAKFIITNPAFP